MMTSNNSHIENEAFVWVWLPHATEPVVAGVMTRQGQQFIFNYGRGYLARADAIALYAPELPLQAGAISLIAGLNMPACIRDASPDAWGRRVLINRKLGVQGASVTPFELDELTYLLESGSDRIGALDFQKTSTRYEPRQSQQKCSLMMGHKNLSLNFPQATIFTVLLRPSLLRCDWLIKLDCR